MPILFYAQNDPNFGIEIGRFADSSVEQRTGWDISGPWNWHTGQGGGWFLEDSETGSCTSDPFTLESTAKYMRLEHRANGNNNQYVILWDENDNQLEVRTWIPGTNDYYSREIDVSAYVGQVVKLRFVNYKTGSHAQMGVRNIRITDASGTTLSPFI